MAKSGWITIGEDDSARHVFLWDGKIYAGKSAYKMSEKHSFDKSKAEYKNGKMYHKSEQKPDELAKEEKDAIEEYVSGNGMWINQYLRGRGDFGELSEEEKQYLEDLTKATDRPLEPQTLYRSVDAQAIFGRMSDGEYEDLRNYITYGENTFGKGSYAQRLADKQKALIENTEGKTIEEKGFMSTTKDFDVASEWGDFTGSDKPVVLEIKAGEGVRGVDASYTDANVDEGEAQQEILLAKGQKLRVESIENKDGQIYVKCTMGNEAENSKETTKSTQQNADPFVEKFGAYAYQVPAIKQYVGTDDVSADANAINRALSSAKALGIDITNGKSKFSDTVNALDKAMTIKPLEQDMTLYRGVSKDALKGIKEGDTIDMNGRYTSTSASEKVAEGYQNGGYILTIHAPKGTESIDVKEALKGVSNSSNSKKEQEYLLSRKLKYKVIKINGNRIELQIV